MLDSKIIFDRIKSHGFEHFAGVPCSILGPLFSLAEKEEGYLGCANEGDAVSLAAGMQIGKKKMLVMMQNSGLGNAINPLSSLLAPFKIPIFLFISWRGEPDTNDEPQHELMGEHLPSLLNNMGFAINILSADIDSALSQIDKANNILEGGQSVALIVRKGTLSTLLNKNGFRAIENSSTNEISSNEDKARYKRNEFLKVVQEELGQNAIILAGTGKCGRELCQLQDRANQLYMIGSMGCLPSFGLGINLARRDKQIVLLDGDSAFMMRLESSALSANYGNENFLHIVFNNYCHDSTGGQHSLSAKVNVQSVASSLGYRNSETISDLNDLRDFLRTWHITPVKTFLQILIRPGSQENLARPIMKPFEVKERLMHFLLSK